MTATGNLEYIAVPASAAVAALQQFGGPETFLSDAEQRASLRFRRRIDARSYSAAHSLFRLMAARRLGTNPRLAASIPVKKRCRTCGGEHGKPAVHGTELSLSRSAGVVMVASSPEGTAVGVDIEQLPSRVFTGFDDYALTPRESSSLMAEDVDGRMQFWVAKEAALKATGHGLAVEPSTLSVCRTTAAAGTWTARIAHDRRDTPASGLNQLRLTWPDTVHGFAAALATTGTPAIHRLSLQEMLPRT